MAELTNANSARPSSLGAPVPGKDAQNEADAFLADFTPPEPPAASAPAAEAPSPEAEAAQFMQTDAPPDQFASEPGFVQANVEQFQPKNFIDRLQAGLAANDTEKVGFLKQKYGDGNVRMKDDHIYYRRADGDKFKRLDPATFELISDIIPDFAREMVTETAMLLGEVTGGVIGTAAAPGAGTVGGAIAGRVASVPVANAFADSVAEAAGVPQDPSRNQRMENAVGMTAEAVLPAVGAKVGGMVMKRLPGTMAYKAAKEAGEKEIVALSAQNKEVAQAAANLAELGRAAKIDGAAVGVPGASVSLMGHQLSPDAPLAQKYAAVAASDPRFINAQNQLAEDWGSSLENTLLEIGRRNGKGSVDPSKLASSITNAVDNVAEAEGKAIGVYKAKALAATKNAKQPLPPEIAQRTQELLREYGFKPRTVETKSLLRREVPDLAGGTAQVYQNQAKKRTVWSAPTDLRPYVNNGLTSTGEVRAVVNNLGRLAKGLDRGLSLTEMESLRNNIGATSARLGRTKAGADLGALQGGLREQYRKVITDALPNRAEQNAFNSSMDEFSMIRSNVDTLRNALNEDSSAKAIVNKFFTGPENLQKIQAIKRLSPDSAAALKEEFVNKLLTDYANRESKTGFSSGKFLNDVNKKYGNQFLKEVFDDGPGPNLDTVKQLLLVNERLENTYKGVKVDTMSEEQKRGVMNLVIGLYGSMKGRVADGAKAIFGRQSEKESALIGVMTRDGIDKYVGAYPGKIDKELVRSRLAEVLAQHRVLSDVAAKGAPAAKRVIKRKSVDESMDTLGGRE